MCYWLFDKSTAEGAREQYRRETTAVPSSLASSRASTDTGLRACSVMKANYNARTRTQACPASPECGPFDKDTPKRGSHPRSSPARRAFALHLRRPDNAVDHNKHIQRDIMGNKVTIFTEQQLEDYQDATFFNRKDILRVHRRFRELAPEVVPKTMTEESSRELRLARSLVGTLPELKENPFRDRILKVFSSNGTGDLSFEDFLDFLSIFSEHAPRELKLHYAFRIYDMDGDGVIGPEDLKTVIGRLCQHERGLTPAEIEDVADKILDEADVDCDGHLTPMEFSHVVARAPDFMTTFHIRI